MEDPNNSAETLRQDIEDCAMLTWTLAFISVFATATLLGMAASWDGLLRTGRIGVIVFVTLALLAGGRLAIRRMARPWEDTTARRGPLARRPCVDVARVRDHPVGKRGRARESIDKTRWEGEGGATRTGPHVNEKPPIEPAQA